MSDYIPVFYVDVIIHQCSIVDYYKPFVRKGPPMWTFETFKNGKKMYQITVLTRQLITFVTYVVHIKLLRLLKVDVMSLVSAFGATYRNLGISPK